MKALYVGFVSSDEVFQDLLDRDRRMPVQTQRFGRSLLDALAAGGAQVTALSVAPATDFPLNRRILFRRSTFRGDGFDGLMAGFVNVLGVKHLTRRLGLLREARRRFGVAPGESTPDVVVVHGVNSSVLAAARTMGDWWGVPCVVVLTDPPHGMTSRDEVPASRLRRVNFRQVLAELDRYDAAVALTADLAEVFMGGRPALVMEGIAGSPLAHSPTAGTDDAGVDVLYAGGVDAEYGVLELVAALEQSRGDWVLGIAGRGSASQEVAERAAGQPRLRHLGMLGSDELAARYAAARVLVNPRPPLPFTRFSFPSKILEYLTNGNVVASTRLPGIPDEYWEHLVELPQDAAGMATVLDDVMSWDAERVQQKVAANRAFVEARKSRGEQGRRLVAFLAGLRR